MCVTDADCSGGLSCQPLLTQSSLVALLELWASLDSSYDLSYCGGAASVITKLFSEAASLFGWAGPAAGMPASVSSLSVCQLTLTQVRPLPPPCALWWRWFHLPPARPPAGCWHSGPHRHLTHPHSL